MAHPVLFRALTERMASAQISTNTELNQSIITAPHPHKCGRCAVPQFRTTNCYRYKSACPPSAKIRLGDMEDVHDDIEHQMLDNRIRPFANHTGRRGQDRSPQPTTTEALAQPPTMPHQRRTSGMMHSNQAVPNLPDESTIRALPPLPFIKPYYTIVSDATNSSTTPETCYPRTRYIFNDDNPDLLTDAFLSQPCAEARESNETRRGVDSQTQLPGPDRALLVDLCLAPDGKAYAVQSATSLATDWAVTGAQLQHLQNGPSGGASEEDSDPTMVLYIQGLGLPTSRRVNTKACPISNPLPDLGEVSTSLPRDRNGTPIEGDYHTLVHSFESRMAFLHSISLNTDGNKPQT